MLRGASFDSTAELVGAIEAFIEYYNETAKPFELKNGKSKGRRCKIHFLTYAVKH
jgi:hypothetical protein